MGTWNSRLGGQSFRLRGPAVRGPMGLEELTSYKWLGIGNGQIRS
jgi:hypothetical protein